MALHDDLLNTSVSAPLGDVLGLWQGIIGSVESYVMTLWRPWVGYQLLIALAVLLVAQLLKMVLAPRLHAWMRAREGWPMWRIRWLVVLHKRLRGILFVGMIWLVVIVMRDLTWNSRSYQLSIIANLATAWLVVALTTRLIGNPILRKAVRYGAWVWVTLSILGQTDTFTNLMDNIAFSIGTMRISVLLVVQAILILGVLWFAARFMSHTVRSRITGNADISPSMQVLAVKAMQLLFYGMAVFIGLKTIGIDLTGLAVLSGAIGVGLGFGLQKVVSNLVSGIILLLDKSIKPGDVISLGDTFGWINSLGARYVSITTRDGKEYLIPNEDLITGQVVNWSHSNDFVRLDIYFGTAYGDNPHDVRRIA
ncbi:MAG: small-conductance mechanosensitive channel, partial [Loktanella salsilacus]